MQVGGLGVKLVVGGGATIEQKRCQYKNRYNNIIMNSLSRLYTSIVHYTPYIYIYSDIYQALATTSGYIAINLLHWSG